METETEGWDRDEAKRKTGQGQLTAQPGLHCLEIDYLAKSEFQLNYSISRFYYFMFLSLSTCNVFI